MLIGMSATSRVALALLALVLAASAAAPATAAHASRHHRPNLVVSAVDLTVTGRAVSGTVTVRNAGDVRAARSTTAVGAELIATPALRAGHRARLVVATTVPAGATRLLVCADATHRIRERREGDNCRSVPLPSSGTTPGPTPGAPYPSAGLPTSGVHASPGPPPVN